MPGDAIYFMRTEIDNIDFKNEKHISKEIRNKNVRKPYLKTKKDKGSTNETIKYQKILLFQSQVKMQKLLLKK